MNYLFSKLLNFVTDFAVVDAYEFNDFIKDFYVDNNIPYDMNYLKREERYDFRKFFPQGKSIVVCIFQYWNSDYEKEYENIISKIKNPFDFLIRKYPKLNKEILKIRSTLIARYALFNDYHKVIRDKLKDVIYELKKNNINAKIFVDTSPVFEKILAAYSGLGFIGKNTLLINPLYGSYFFIGGFFLDTKIDQVKKNLEYKKICDDCRLCEKECPTNALSCGWLNPLKCISYWTTHNKNKEIPSYILEKSPYIFGCDICQKVCPYNKDPISKSLLFKLDFNDLNLNDKV